jgi:hypothetical protein
VVQDLGFYKTLDFEILIQATFNERDRDLLNLAKTLHEFSFNLFYFLNNNMQDFKIFNLLNFIK